MTDDATTHEAPAIFNSKTRPQSADDETSNFGKVNYLEVTRHQLQDANENLLAILDESKLGVLMLDEKSHIQFVNHAVQMFFQQDKKSLLGKHWQRALPLSSDQKQTMGVQLALPPSESRLRVSIKVFSDNKETFWGEIEVYF